MHIPSEVRILGLTYQVKIVRDLEVTIKPYIKPKKEQEAEYFGYFVPSILTIFLSELISPQMQESTFIHEVIEVINCHLDLNMKHSDVNKLEAALYQVLTENDLFN